MKTSTFISMLALLIPLAGISQNQGAFIDDVYFKPSTAPKMIKSHESSVKPNVKNGAKEIVYIERETQVLPKTAKILAQINDSIVNSHQRNVDTTNVNESELEYAQRIRQFHNSKDTVLLIDTVYISQNDNDPYWWNNNYYGNWGWGNRWNSPYYGYGGWYNNPWGYNNFYGYGGFGYGYPFYGDYYGYGYGYPYYGYDYYGYGYPYYGYGYNNYWGGGGWYNTIKTPDPSHMKQVAEELVMKFQTVPAMVAVVVQDLHRVL